MCLEYLEFCKLYELRELHEHWTMDPQGILPYTSELVFKTLQCLHGIRTWYPQATGQHFLPFLSQHFNELSESFRPAQHSDTLRSQFIQLTKDFGKQLAYLTIIHFRKRISDHIEQIFYLRPSVHLIHRAIDSAVRQGKRLWGRKLHHEDIMELRHRCNNYIYNRNRDFNYTLAHKKMFGLTCHVQQYRDYTSPYPYFPNSHTDETPQINILPTNQEQNIVTSPRHTRNHKPSNFHPYRTYQRNTLTVASTLMHPRTLVNSSNNSAECTSKDTNVHATILGQTKVPSPASKQNDARPASEAQTTPTPVIDKDRNPWSPEGWPVEPCPNVASPSPLASHRTYVSVVSTPAPEAQTTSTPVIDKDRNPWLPDGWSVEPCQNVASSTPLSSHRARTYASVVSTPTILEYSPPTPHTMNSNNPSLHWLDYTTDREHTQDPDMISITHISKPTSLPNQELDQHPSTRRTILSQEEISEYVASVLDEILDAPIKDSYTSPIPQPIVQDTTPTVQDNTPPAMITRNTLSGTIPITTGTDPSYHASPLPKRASKKTKHRN